MDKITIKYYNTPEDVAYETWEYHEEDKFEGYRGCWVKKDMPNYLTKEEELDWYMISNEEDIYFISQEKKACLQWLKQEKKRCLEWYEKEKYEIEEAQEYNKMLKRKQVIK